MEKLEQGMKCNAKKCGSCMFGPKPIDLLPGRLQEILDMLASGGNQICHGTNNATICRGGRDLQLKMFFAKGIIEAPTDEALAKAMQAYGIEPKTHITESV